MQALRQSQLPPHQEKVQQLRVRQKQQITILRLEECKKTLILTLADRLQLLNLDNFPNSFK